MAAATAASGGLLPGGPVHAGDLHARRSRHREVTRASCRESRPEQACGSGDPAVRLGEGVAARGLFASPASRRPPLGLAKGGGPQTGEERLCRRLLVGVQAAPELLDADRADLEPLTRAVQARRSRSGARAPAQVVDQVRRVKQRGQRTRLLSRGASRSARRVRCTQAAGLSSNLRPASPMRPRDFSISSQRLGSSSASRSACARKPLRPRGPTRRSSSETSESSSVMCRRMAAGQPTVRLGRRCAQSGMLPCLRAGPGSRLVSSVCSAATSRGRVSCGTITSSM